MTQINIKTNLKVSKTKLRSWLKILKTSNFIEKQIREKLREDHNTTLPRFDVMSALYRSKKGLKMTEISGALKYLMEILRELLIVWFKMDMF